MGRGVGGGTDGTLSMRTGDAAAGDARVGGAMRNMDDMAAETRAVGAETRKKPAMLDLGLAPGARSDFVHMANTTKDSSA